MNIQAEITPPIMADKFADVSLIAKDAEYLCRLRIDFATLRRLGPLPSDVVFDFLLLAAIVYALDRRIRRASADDAWTRHFTVLVPVADPALWTAAQPSINQCLSFLTGDVWDLSFAKRGGRLAFPSYQQRLVVWPQPQAVSLFSGGLDSLIGVIDYLESHQNASIMLVGHHDPRIGSVLSEQEITYEALEQSYAGRMYPVFPWIGADSGKDTTLRSRSFLFLALGVYVAQLVSDTTPVLIPENGTIALNVPLTASRTGSCSTRTAHPYYLAQLCNILRSLGIGTPIVNPLASKTKGECVKECLNRTVLEHIAHYTISCAKRGHTRTWLRRQTKQCGRCMPCIYRRAALHTIGYDTEPNGRDFCTGEVDLSSDKESADDLRACLSFLAQNYTPGQIGTLLIENGRLDIDNLRQYADTVARAMEEIRTLIRDKATAEIKMRAGLGA